MFPISEWSEAIPPPFYWCCYILKVFVTFQLHRIEVELWRDVF
jgi:hypothetical protein